MDINNWLAIMSNFGYEIIGTFLHPFMFEFHIPILNTQLKNDLSIFDNIKLKEIEFKKYKHGWLMIASIEDVSRGHIFVPYFVDNNTKREFEKEFKKFIKK